MKLEQFQNLESQFQVELKKLQPIGLIALTSDEQDEEWDFSYITYCIVISTKEDGEKIGAHLFEQILLFNMLLPEVDYLREGKRFKFI